LQEQLVNEIQEVYRLQGVTINDKHIEIIIRQMLRKVRITEPGDTTFLWGEQIDKNAFEDENERVEKIGGQPSERRRFCSELPRLLWRLNHSLVPPHSRIRHECSQKPRPWAKWTPFGDSRRM
jgi:hypothetical protein